MGFKRKLFKNQVVATKVGSSGEIDLRKEFDSFLNGGNGDTPHRTKALIRSFRLDSDNKKVPCTCLSSISKEPSYTCNFCLGEGYFWDEKWVWCYSYFLGADSGQANRKRNLAPGIIRVDYKIFYFKYDTDLKYNDKIIELKLDTEGDPIVPYIRKAIYSPQTIVENRSDNGRLEYYTVYCREQDAIRNDP